jgi:hypothetical protein
LRASGHTQLVISGLLASPWLLAAAGFRLLLLITSLVALFRVRPFWFLLRLMAGLVATTVGVFAAAVGFGTVGYRALTHEAVVAQVRPQPCGHAKTGPFRLCLMKRAIVGFGNECLFTTLGRSDC